MRSSVLLTEDNDEDAARVAQALARSSLSDALGQAGVAIATLDGTGIFVSVNAAFRTIFGHTPTWAEQARMIDLVHESDRARFAEALALGQTGEVVVHASHQDGSVITVHLTVVARGAGRGHHCFARDLAFQRRLEGKLTSAAAVAAVGPVAMGLTHEINNPLGVVLANLEEGIRVAEGLEHSVSASVRSELLELRTMLEEAFAASRRVQFIMRDLRAFAGADARGTGVDVNAVVESCCNIALAEIRHRARLVKELGTIKPVVGTEAELAQVFLNVLVNAAHAVSDGGIDHNEIVVTTRQHGHAAVVVEISDTGTGIPAAIIDEVFEPFFTTKPHRSGMGLAVSQGTIASLRGEIQIRNREGGGTVVRVVLPTVEAGAVERAAKPQVERTSQQPRVLVVDDDPLVLRSLTRVLARDFEVSAARNGREALELVRNNGDFDAMLCDLIMPELSGIDLHELLERENPQLARSTVFLTGGAFGSRAQTFLESVGQPHLEKPVDVKTVRDVLTELSRANARTSSKRLGGSGGGSRP